MAKFKMELPAEIVKQMQSLNDNCEEIFGAMTRAGAEVVNNNIEANVPDGIKKSKMMDCLKTTKTYKTPSDDGINTKVGFYGYFENEDGKKIAVLVNINDHRLQTQLEVDGKLWLFEMLEDSIYTIIFE